MMIHFWENTFWTKTSLSFVFTEPNSVHPEVFRHANHNGTSFKAVWWSISEKTHFGAKTSLSFVFRWPNLSAPWGFQACQLQWYKFQSCMMIHLWENIFGTKTLISFVFTGPSSAHPEVFSHANHNGTKYSKLYMMIHFWEIIFGAKTSTFLWWFTGPNLSTPWDFQSCKSSPWYKFQSCMPWSISEKTHFGLKHHFPFYLQGQTQGHPEISAMPIINGIQVYISCMMILLSETIHIWAKFITFFCIYRAQLSAPWGFQGMRIKMVQVSKLYDDLFLRKYIWH